MQATAGSAVDPTRLAKTLARGSGAGAAFDPGTRLLDSKLEAAKARQAAAEAAWKAECAAVDEEWTNGDVDAVPSQASVIVAEGETVHNGVRIPKHLTGPTAVAYVITQRKGTIVSVYFGLRWRVFVFFCFFFYLCTVCPMAHAGALKPKDLKAAVAIKRMQTQKQAAAQEAMRAALGPSTCLIIRVSGIWRRCVHHCSVIHFG